MLTHEITDSSWLAAGSLLVGAGHHMLQYGQKTAGSDAVKAHPGLFEEVTQLNGPLPDYHPQMILQCLLWGERDSFSLLRTLTGSLYCREDGSRQSGHREALRTSCIAKENFRLLMGTA